MANPESRSVTKRELFKSLPKVALGIATGIVIANEVTKARGEILTSTGTFYPIYEVHDQDVDVSGIPHNLSVLFQETSIEGGSFTLDKITTLTAWDSYFKRVLPDELLLAFAREGTQIAFGDVYLPPAVSKLDINIEVAEFLIGSSIGIFWAIGSKFNLELTEKLNIQLPRRQLLSRSIYAGSLWAVSPTIGDIITTLSVDNSIPIERIMTRVQGLNSHLHPELSVIFLRNLLMADKLLLIGQHLQKDNKENPRIGFRVGALHSGIEDFLQAGPEICRMLILAMPKKLLQTLVDENNSIEDFCSARLIKLPQDLNPDDFWYRNNLPARIEDQRITDNILQQALIDKLK